MLVKGWRNDESHISPTASEQEINAAIKIIVTLYFYTTGSCIDALNFANKRAKASAPKAPYKLLADQAPLRLVADEPHDMTI